MQLCSCCLFAHNFNTLQNNTEDKIFCAINTDTHTHTVLMAIFPSEPGLVVAPLILFFSFVPKLCILWDRPQLSLSWLMVHYPG